MCGVLRMKRLQCLVLATAAIWIGPLGATPKAHAQAAPWEVLPLGRASWLWSSIPLDSSGTSTLPALVSQHALVQWYNPIGVLRHDLDPTLTDERGGDQSREVLEVQTLNPSDSAAFTPSTWTGLTHSISSSGTDLLQVQSVEIWVNDHRPDHTQTHGRLHVDLGRVSEDAFWRKDVPPNGKLDSEDKNSDTKLDEGEDTGLDGLFDQDEPGYDPVTNSDPDRDDYRYDPRNPNDYSHINGTEGNSIGVPNARPDTEDLDQNGNLDVLDSYFEATIDLSDTAYVAVDVPRDYAGSPVVKSDNGWRLFRLPVTSAFLPRGSPAWDAVKHVRLWLDAMTGPTNIQVGGISLVGLPNPETLPIATLHQNYPNPFNPETFIQYEISHDGPVRLAIYSVSGKLVRVLTNSVESAGFHRKAWSGQDATGRPVASGVYFYRLDVGGVSVARRMVLAR